MIKVNRFFSFFLFSMILSFCSFSYEFVIAESVKALLHNGVVWYSLVISFFVASLGVGVFLYERIKVKSLFYFLCVVELILSFLGLVIPLIIELSVSNLFTNSIISVCIFFLILFLCISSVGILSGFELPALIDLADTKKKSSFNVILAADYFGALIAGIAFALFFVSRFSLFEISFIIASINFIVATCIYVFFLKRRSWFILSFGVMLISLFLLFFTTSDLMEQRILKNFFYRGDEKIIEEVYGEVEDVDIYRSKYQTLNFVKVYFSELYLAIFEAYLNKVDDSPNKDVLLLINRSPQEILGYERAYHEYFSHIPIILNKSVPRNILVIGAGDGLLDRELLKYPEVEKITHVELDPEMIRLSNEHEYLLSANEGAFLDERVEVITVDGFSYVMNYEEDDKYDAVYIDLPHATGYAVSRLFSLEFYSGLKRLMTDDAYVVMDEPYSLAYEEKQKESIQEKRSIMFNTFERSGFTNVVGFGIELESDNEKVLAVLDEMYDDYIKSDLPYTNVSFDPGAMESEGLRESIKKAVLLSFIDGIYQSFVFLNSNDSALGFEYRDIDAGSYVLNEERFKLAFRNQMKKDLDVLDYNSVFKPSLLRDNYNL